MTTQQYLDFIKELSALAKKHGYAFGGGGNPNQFKLTFFPREAREAHNPSPNATPTI